MAYIKVYVGMPELSIEDFLYVDLIVNGRPFNLYSYEESLEELSGESYLYILEDALNIAKMVSSVVNLKIVIDELVLDFAEDFSDKDKKQIYALIKEVQNDSSN